MLSMQLIRPSTRCTPRPGTRSRPVGSEAATAVPKARRRAGEGGGARISGVLYPRWYWPSFAGPATIWLVLLFVLPFYVVFAVAFGTSDLFGNALPVYQPWYWSGSGRAW